MQADLCVICGKIVPEGRMVCPICEAKPPKPNRMKLVYIHSQVPGIQRGEKTRRADNKRGGSTMTNLITEARELCKYSEKIVNQLHTERLDYELEYMPLIETIQVTSELCDALEKAEAEAKALNDCNQKLAEQNRRLIWRNWIPITEGLPEERQHENGEPIEFNVIISGAKVPTTLCFDGAEWRDFWKDGGYGPAYAVTHWMPLPEPPEEGAEK